MSELNIKIRKLQDNGSTFRATPESLYMGGVGSAKVDTLCFDVPEEWKGCAITLHVQRLSGTLPDPQLLDEKNRAVVDQRWTKEKQGLWMLMAVGADGYTAMTKPGRYTCYETIDRDSTTETITPSVYEQFVALVKKETAEANRAAKNAAASAEIAKNFESTITATGEQVQREITATADQTKKDLTATADQTQKDLTATADQTKQAIEEKARAALASIPEDYTALSESVGQLKEDLDELYNVDSIDNIIVSENVQIGGGYCDVVTDPILVGHNLSWTVESGVNGISLNYILSSNRNYLCIFVAKTRRYYGAKISKTSSFVQTMFSSKLMEENDIYAFEFTPNDDGYLYIQALNSPVSIDIYLYDITDASEEKKAYVRENFSDSVVLSKSCIISNIEKEISSKYKNEIWSGLGDSITADGSGGQYITYTKHKLGLSDYVNCGIGGTRISGAPSDSTGNCMFTDTRINTLDVRSKVVTIFGGTNDAYQNYYELHPDTNNVGWGEMTKDNADTKSFVGAYNVMLSKIYYKFRQSDGYYDSIDYSGVTRVDENSIPNDFRIFIIVPPRRWDTGSINLVNAGKVVADKVRQIAEMWGIPYVDLYNDMGMNDINKNMFWKHQTTPDYVHPSPYAHSIIASLLCDKVNANNNVDY